MTGIEHAVQRFERLFGPEPRGVLGQHLAETDDGVKRRAQFMAHIGEELRLVLARFRELAALVLDFVEQPHVLDRDHRLVGEGPDKLDLLARERPNRPRSHTITPIGLPSRSIGTPSMVRPPIFCASTELVGRVGQDIGDLDDAALA